MVYKKLKNNLFLVRLDVNDEVVNSLGRFARDANTCGAVWGIGALEYGVVGYFDEKLGRYEKMKVDGGVELLSLMGNIAMKDGEFFPHIHVALGRRSGEVFGGHLFEGVVSVTAEILVFPWDINDVERKVIPESGIQLALWNF